MSGYCGKCGHTICSCEDTKPKIDQGGSAFPESYVGDMAPHSGVGGGMTLRDYFAAKAMQGMAAGPFWCENFDLKNKAYIDPIAAVAYTIADAMIAQRNKTNEH